MSRTNAFVALCVSDYMPNTNFFLLEKGVCVCVCGGVIMFYDETKRLEHHDALENSFNVDKGKVDILF